MKNKRTYVYGIRLTEEERQQIMTDSRKYAYLIYEAVKKVLEEHKNE